MKETSSCPSRLLTALQGCHITLKLKPLGLKQGCILESLGERIAMLYPVPPPGRGPNVGTTPPAPCCQPRPHLSLPPPTSPNSTSLIHWLFCFQASGITYAVPQPPSLPPLPPPPSGPAWTFPPSLTALPSVCSDVSPPRAPCSRTFPITAYSPLIWLPSPLELHAGRAGLASASISLTKTLSLTKLRLL